MIISKYAKQKMEVLEKSQPDLHATMKLHEDKEFPEYIKLGNAAGLIIEYVLKSGGNPSVFQSMFDDYIIDEYLID